MAWYEDAAEGKSSTWPQGEPREVREAAEKAERDAKAAKDSK